MKQRLVLLLMILFLPVAALAHSGGTDSKGGHYDRSTGKYHYHHGYSAHQHPNGICPYDSRYSTVTQATSTPKIVIRTLAPTKKPLPTNTPTPRPSPTTLWAGTSSLQLASNTTTASSTPTPTSKLRPAVTVAPRSMVTSTPRATVTTTATPRITSTASDSALPYHIIPSTVETVSFDWKNILFVVIALLSLCHTVLSSIKQRKEREKYYADLRILRRDLKQKEEYISSVDKKISLLEQKLHDANRHIEQQRVRQFSSGNFSHQIETAKAESEKSSEHELQLAYAKISNLEQKLNGSYDRIEKLKKELESALIHTPKYSVPATPQLTPTPRMTLFYKTHYPKTWGYIENNTIYPDSYVSIYNYYWGELQKRHGDGIVFDTLTDQEQSYVRYLPCGDYVFLSDIKSDTYHINPNCYSLLKTPYLTVDAIHANGRKRCTKCVPPPK